MKKPLCIFIAGTAGVGKNTIINETINKNKDKFYQLISNTSRPKRVDDKPNAYHYVESNEEFKKMIESGEIIEFDMFNGYYYGMSRTEVEKAKASGKIIINEISVLGIKNSKELLKNDFDIVSVFLTAPKSILKQRLISRQYNKKQLKNRLKLFKSENAQIPNFDYVIYNINLETALNQFRSIFVSELNNYSLTTLQSTQEVNAKKVDKLCDIYTKKSIPTRIEVTALNDKIYLVNNINEYLAHLKSNNHIYKVFVDNSNASLLSEQEMIEWEKLIKLYKN